ncbi:capsular polysaccharide biosynthesis protein [Derxia lacustris]|uniref:capsular polysaccharide biosynthesis protein n=1 Tax=Derxia lacustris TaxID=764842 RepID=UPI00111BEA3E|nr:capsular polysaccharide biosynthesis protein [Derxia lacustris]
MTGTGAFRYAVFNRGLRRLDGLDVFLGAPVARCRFMAPAGIEATLGWGRSPHGRHAEAVARRRGIAFIHLEDGFLRSVGFGRAEPPLSLLVDDLGVHYDAGAPSRLEALVRQPLDAARTARARALIAAWRAARVSKYNHAREFAGELPPRYVLLADQTFGDGSIRHGQASPASFARLLARALAERPDCRVLVKVHPEVLAGRKRGHFDLAELRREPRVLLLGEDVHPVRLIEQAEAVYAVTSQIGFEALLWGRPVHVEGMPFYAGWGLTADARPAPDRRCPVALESLVHAALVDYPRYRDPETGARCEVERVLDWLGLQRAQRERFPRQIFAAGFSAWKRPIVRDFLQGSQVSFVEGAAAGGAGADAAVRSGAIAPDATLAVWGRAATDHAGPLLRLEDGFVRSVGLGADLVRPLSWVMDRRGIYFDATRESDLEHLLATAQFDAPLLARAAALRERLVAEGLTKYNVGSGAAAVNAPAGRRRLLVVGQVESDASLRYGAPGIARNLDLLRAVRAAAPDAWIVYKPHPDVVAGLRHAGQGEDGAAAHCDQLLADAPMGALLLAVDEVHVLTSLAGFEALLRGRRVVCWGQPFYAGWGLTDDRLPPARRGRALPLDALVAAALLLYPVYLSRTTGRYTTAERALDELLAWRAGGPARLPWWRRLLRALLTLRAR